MLLFGTLYLEHIRLDKCGKDTENSYYQLSVFDCDLLQNGIINQRAFLEAAMQLPLQEFFFATADIFIYFFFIS